jgi:hypothetical protein
MDVRCKQTTAPARHVNANRPFDSALDYARTEREVRDQLLGRGLAGSG